ncbi:hypothetical protein NA57DRAFT_35982 [Rhizodiscina lignyota]|uniref:SMP-30/Gluconolactonase/LRE-like region domain-containing protein n=1 Tax=Rhizodiscina lignyota TaxID=1504668 RepID=A0A9P4IJI1_9PEZI|nr:hypothetical protein NA57DRAFT_35982 [Rhizodiscina lignyota]
MLAVPALSQSNLTVQIPPEDTLLLPRPFNNTFDQPFVNTSGLSSNSSTKRTITAARRASFISYDASFRSILGDSPSVKLLVSSANANDSFAFEGGVWDPNLNQVWFTAFLNPTPGYVSILDLNTSTVIRPNITGARLPNPNGGYYFNGKVYMTTFGDTVTSPAIVAIDPHTYHATEVVNSFFGLPFGGPDDITVAVSNVTQQPCFFFSDFFFSDETLHPGTVPGPSGLPYFVWRYTPHDNNLKPVIGPLDVQVPNGIAVDSTNSILYVTDGPSSAVFQRPPNHTFPSFAGVYQFDLGGPDGCTPQNKRLFSFARQGLADGIKVGDAGRVWTAEYEGVVVRNGSTGKVLGLFNAADIILENTENPVNVRDVAPLANFALAGDKLVILAFNRIFGVDLAETVVNPVRYGSS